MNPLLKRSAQALVASALLVTAGAGAAQAAIDYSDDPLAPTPLTFNNGKLEIEVRQIGAAGACVAGQNCKDYVTFTVPTGRVLNSLKMTKYNSTDDRAFVALQAGNQFTANPDFTTTPASLPGALAYNHNGWRGLCSVSYGPARPATASSNNNCIQADNVTPVVGANTDLLKAPSLGGVLGAVGSLPAGTYTMWLQQVSGDSEYSFVASTAVPGPLPLVGTMGALAMGRRLRRRLKVG